MAVTETRDNPYLQGIYAPIEQEHDAVELSFKGQVPRDLNGIFARNGPNPRFTPPGRYHWFDGDGMIHAVEFNNGKATYRNRYVNSSHFEMESQAGKALWGGLMEPFAADPRKGLFKDTSNTDITFHNGSLKTMWYLSGELLSVDPISLETKGPDSFDEPLIGQISAHPKVDPRTGEMLFFGYGMKPPFMFYGELNSSGKLQYQCPVPLPGPRLPHDMAFTEHYGILMDLPVFYNIESLKKGRWKSEFHSDMPSRFALVPRKGVGGNIRWFEAEPGYVYHSINAWEEGDTVVMVGCKVDQPINPPKEEEGIYAQMMANLRVRARLQRWTFNLKTGQTKEEPIDDRNTEFPSVNLNTLGVKSRFSYNMDLAPTPTLLFDGISKYDIISGECQRHSFEPGAYACEAPFAPKDNAQDEDDGYLVTIVRGGADDKSEVQVFDAKEIARGPIATAELPQDVPIGFHATWVEGNQL